MIIRNETQADVRVIANIIKTAFENHPYSNHTEEFIVRELRAAGALTISLVAEMDGEIVGHIAFSPVMFSDGGEDWYGLGPVSVLPRFQRQGIGTKLVNEGVDLLKGLGAEGCILVGDPNFYQRFGFRSPEGVRHEGVPQENLLTLPSLSIVIPSEPSSQNNFLLTSVPSLLIS